MKLIEQIYTNKKVYYHISPNKFTEFEYKPEIRRWYKDSEGGIFLTSKLLTTYRYAQSFHKRFMYLYKCILIKPLNLFNPSSKKDRTLFINEIKNDPKKFFEEFKLKNANNRYDPKSLNGVLKELFNSHYWAIIENPTIAKIIKKLEYDGYISNEMGIDNLFIFNPSNIKIIKYDQKSKFPWKIIHQSYALNQGLEYEKSEESKASWEAVGKKSDYSDEEINTIKKQSDKYGFYKQNIKHPYTKINKDEYKFKENNIRSFEQIYRLRERHYNITDIHKTSNFKQLEDKLSQITDIPDMSDKLMDTERQNNWDFVSTKAKDALDLLMQFDKDWEQHLIVSGEEPIGLFMMQHGRLRYLDIEEIALIAFKSNNITLVKDVFEIMEKSRKLYNSITWSVRNDNPIKRAYNKKVKEWGGHISEWENHTRYRLEKI